MSIDLSKPYVIFHLTSGSELIINGTSVGTIVMHGLPPSSGDQRVQDTPANSGYVAFIVRDNNNDQTGLVRDDSCIGYSIIRNPLDVSDIVSYAEEGNTLLRKCLTYLESRISDPKLYDGIYKHLSAIGAK